MSLTPSAFTQAEYLDGAPLVNAPVTPTSALFARAIVFGLAGVLVGAVIYAAFIAATGINIGYLAILVAWLVARAMVTGSRGEGGRTYQITALVLTYLSVALARAGVIWWEVAHHGTPIPMKLHNVVLLTKLGLLSPLVRLQSDLMGGVIGLVILLVGLRAAWRMTSGNPAAVRHPFAR